MDDLITVRARTAVDLAGAKVLVGACSWAEHTLVKESGWYPKKTMKAAQRMAYYASRLPLVEVENTYRFPPTPDVARQWVERTPEGFTIDVRAWSLLAGQPTIPASLWDDLQTEVRPEARDNVRLYSAHLSADAKAESWRRFDHALRPLHDAGRLGCVLFQIPHWLKPGDTGRALVAEARDGLPDYRLSVEFGNPHWLDGGVCESTLEMLEDLGVSFTCVDAPQVEPVAAATADLSVVRLYGRYEGELDDIGPLRPVHRFGWRYSDEELGEWVPRIRELAASTGEVHVLFNNCYRDYAVTNAERLVELLA